MVERIIRKINDNTERKIQSLMRECSERIRKINEEFAAKTLEEKKRMEENAKKEIETMKKRILSAANLESRKIVLSTVEKSINEAINTAASMLASLPAEEYKQFLSKKIKEASTILGSGFTVHCRKEDASLLAEIGKKFGCAVCSADIKLGGFIAVSKDGSKRLNYTFEEIMKRKMPLLREIAAKIIRGEKDHARPGHD